MESVDCRLEIDGELRAAVREHAESAYPDECCGVLGGVHDGGARKTVRRVVPLVNAQAVRVQRYLIDPDAYREAASSLGAEGLDIVGVYHSHPDAPARPSAFDLAHAWPWLSYVIVGVERGRATSLTSWLLDDDRRAFGREQLCP